MKYIILILIASVLLSQESKQRQSDVKRLDEITIERSDVLNVKGGEKRKPTRLPTLSKSDLDSLNSLEKQQSLLLPPAGLPRQIIPNAQDRAYLRADFGRFATIDAEAGYAFAYQDFDIYSMANLELSNGHLDNAGFLDGTLRLISDYVAPQKFWIFGGSKTRTRFDYNHAEFSNFAVEEAEDRSMDSVSLMMDVEGSYNGFQFYTGAGFDLLSLRSDTSSFGDTGIKGYLNIVNPYKSWRFSGGANAEIRSGNEQSNNFFEGFGKIAYLSKNFDFHIDGGFQIAQNEIESIFVPKFSLGINLQSDNDFTISAIAGSGVQRNTFANFYRFNPYLSWNTFLDHTIDQLYIEGDVKYHPTSRFNFRIGVRTSLMENAVNWINRDSSQFEIFYDNATQLKFFVETFYDLNEKNTISLMLENNNVITDSLENQQTYVPQLKASLDLNSDLFDNFATQVGIDYVGKRFADLNNEIEIDPFIDLRMKFTFKAGDNFNFYLKGENLLNQNIYLFNFYRQRGLFFSGGILWKF
jgi:hypothetical protein